MFKLKNGRHPLCVHCRMVDAINGWLRHYAEQYVTEVRKIKTQQGAALTDKQMAIDAVAGACGNILGELLKAEGDPTGERNTAIMRTFNSALSSEVKVDVVIVGDNGEQFELAPEHSPDPKQKLH